MSLHVVAGAIAQVALALAVGWVIGGILLERSRLIELERGGVGSPERLLFALVGFVSYSVALMLLHIATGGFIFASAWVVPLLTVVVLTLGWRSKAFTFPRRPSWAAMGLFAVLIALYVLPGFIGGSSIRSGDDQWHLGWTQQILEGDRVPVGPAPVDANAYPWGFHAVMATLVRMVPTTTPSVSLEALQVLIVLFIPLAAACLSRLVNRKAGIWAALSVSLIGGFGWIIARAPAFLTSPREPLYGADLTTSSPNALYELLPPPLPRELGVALLAAIAVAAVWAIKAQNRSATITVGSLIGLVGLTSVPMLLCAAVWALSVTVAMGPRGSRIKALGWMFGAAAVMFSLWAAPVAVDYFRYGGFVNITAHLGKEWSFITAAGSWGLLLPLAIAGFVIALRSRRSRPLVILALSSAALLLLAILRDVFDWDLSGNATALHQGRVWPPLHLVGAALAGVAIERFCTSERDRRRRLASVVIAVVFAIGAISPVLASIRLTQIISAHSGGFTFSGPGFDTHAFAARAAKRLDPTDVLLVKGASADNPAGLLAFTLFDYSGARITSYDNPKIPDNDLRVRYKDLAEQWAKHHLTGAYASDFVVTACRGDCPHALVEGIFAGRRWALYRTPSGA